MDKSFFIEAEKWSNLVYAHKRILELLHLERYQKVNGINQLLSDCQDIFEHMEMEQYTISEIIAWGATISISHRKIWSENPIECVKLLLTSIFLGSINVRRKQHLNPHCIRKRKRLFLYMLFMKMVSG